MDKVKVRGRFNEPFFPADTEITCTFGIDHENPKGPFGVTLRFESSSVSEFWMEIDLPEKLIEGMHHYCEGGREYPTPVK